MSEITPEKIITMLPERFNKEEAGDWTAVIQLDISGDQGGNWYVIVEGGGVTVHEGRTDNPTSTMETTDEVWIGMFDGSVNPQMAFMTGQIKIAGNMADVLKLDNQNIFKK